MPICHTKNGKPKALSQARQVKALVEALANIEKQAKRYKKDLIKIGHTIDMIDSNTDSQYLSHLTKNLQHSVSNIGMKSIFTTNPFDCTNKELLEMPLVRGRKSTDIGKTTRSYTRGETEFYKKHLLNQKEYLLQNNCKDILNKKEFFFILRETAKKIISNIKKDVTFPAREKCNQGKYYRLLYDIIGKLDLKQEYLKTTQMIYGKKVEMEAAMQSNNLKKQIERKMRLLKELEESK